ncbi:MAG TPA: 3-deoxy-D-manno-octulosonic acid transferase [Deltaproteobacteria bacterium]|nr:3-deoxy-D-manno-octulosonic acid transferase [Deltaproteobacteria bacterium]HPP81428.1 3-deoxy-D-manno-octulosonic acid transferase [Deltaproteobacteria bacterium]
MAPLLIPAYRAAASVLAWPAAWALRKHPNFKGTILQRLGIHPPAPSPGSNTLWVHASSVGEVRAVSLLVRAIKASRPGLEIWMSCMTATGREVATATEGVDHVFGLPFDTRRAASRHALRLMPKALVVVETEIWPNLFLAHRRLGIPVVLVNARLSRRSERTYAPFRKALSHVLETVEVLAMSEVDARRFRSLGARNVRVLGNLKLDQVFETDHARARALEEELHAHGRPVFVAGSVREGEEGLVLDAVLDIAGRVPGLLAVVAPRHPSRIEHLTGIAESRGIRWTLRSRPRQDADLVVVDTMGELFTLYGIARVAFVGGSLVDCGGQNILEPVAWGVPTVHGPFMDNFSWALEAIGNRTVTVKDARELSQAVTAMLTDLDSSRRLGMEAKAALVGAGGVTKRYLEALEARLGPAREGV